MEDLDAEELNRRAWFAMRHGFSRSVARDLIALLRSGAEIAPEVREELAAALDGGTSSGVRLSVSGNRDGTHGRSAADAQRDAFRIMAHVEAALKADASISDAGAIRDASAALTIDKKKCEEAWYTLRPLYLEHLANVGRGNIGAALDQGAREGLAMSFAYGELQQKRRQNAKPRKGTRSA